MPKLVANGAKLRCDQGLAPGVLTAGDALSVNQLREFFLQHMRHNKAFQEWKQTPKLFEDWKQTEEWNTAAKAFEQLKLREPCERMATPGPEPHEPYQRLP